MGTIKDASRARTDSLRVKLASDMVARYDVAAKDFGMPTSTLAAFALSHWMIDYETKQKLSRAAVLELTRKMTEELTSERMEKALIAALPGVVTAMAQEGYVPIDSEAAPAA